MEKETSNHDSKNPPHFLAHLCGDFLVSTAPAVFNLGTSDKPDDSLPVPISMARTV